VITYWRYRGTGQKSTSHLRHERLRFGNWPDSVTGDGAGYGILAGAKDCWAATVAAGHHYLYTDGPYFLLKKNGSVRFAWDNFWYTGAGPDRRVDDLKGKGCMLRTKKQRGNVVFICPSGPLMHKVGYGDDAEKWTAATVAELKKHTDRPVEVRLKGDPSRSPETRYDDMHAKVFDRAWCVVTAGSTIGVEALAAGVPVISTQNDITRPLTTGDLSTVETVTAPDIDAREVWAHNVAARQFDHVEMRKGKAITHMLEDLQCLNCA